MHLDSQSDQSVIGSSSRFSQPFYPDLVLTNVTTCYGIVEYNAMSRAPRVIVLFRSAVSGWPFSPGALHASFIKLSLYLIIDVCR